MLCSAAWIIESRGLPDYYFFFHIRSVTMLDRPRKSKQMADMDDNGVGHDISSARAYYCSLLRGDSPHYLD